jgi:hypothetical protein
MTSSRQLGPGAPNHVLPRLVCSRPTVSCGSNNIVSAASAIRHFFIGIQCPMSGRAGQMECGKPQLWGRLGVEGKDGLNSRVWGLGPPAWNRL